MSALKTLYKHSSHYLGGRVAVMMLGFVSFPLFKKTKIKPNQLREM